MQFHVIFYGQIKQLQFCYEILTFCVFRTKNIYVLVVFR